MQQLSFFPGKHSSVHGGEDALAKRKSKRPLDRRRPIHFVLKAKRNLPLHSRLIHAELQRLATKFRIRVYDQAIAHDHIHFLAKIPNREDYKKFIRAFTSLLAQKLGRGLWKLLPFSRVAHWGKEFRELKLYLQKNREETSGERPYEPRRDRSARHRKRHNSARNLRRETTFATLVP